MKGKMAACCISDYFTVLYQRRSDLKRGHFNSKDAIRPVDLTNSMFLDLRVFKYPALPSASTIRRFLSSSTNQSATRKFNFTQRCVPLLAPCLQQFASQAAVQPSKCPSTNPSSEKYRHVAACGNGIRGTAPLWRIAPQSSLRLRSETFLLTRWHAQSESNCISGEEISIRSSSSPLASWSNTSKATRKMCLKRNVLTGRSRARHGRGEKVALISQSICAKCIPESETTFWVSWTVCCAMTFLPQTNSELSAVCHVRLLHSHPCAAAQVNFL